MMPKLSHPHAPQSPACTAACTTRPPDGIPSLLQGCLEMLQLALDQGPKNVSGDGIKVTRSALRCIASFFPTMIFKASLFISLSLGATYAQDLGVPLSWRKFSNSRPLSERISIAQAAINTILPQLNTATGEFNGIGYWQSGNVYSAMANTDHYSGGTTNKAQVVNMLNTVFGLRADYDQYGYNDDAMWWAQSAVYAYRAYGDNNLLNHAIDVWNHVSNYVITQDQANSGSNPNKGFTLSGTCDGQSMAGGVFWRPTSDDQGVNSVTTGLYLTLSAFLGEATGDSKYTNAAIASANWIKNLNINSDGIVLDSVNAHDCSRSPANWLFTYNTGKFVEGLSVLAAVTGDSAWSSLMVNTVAKGVKSGAWQGDNGIITEGASPNSNNDGVGFKAVFIRALGEVFTRTNNNDLRTLIHSYADVQYNALLDLAANGTSYSSAWAGPPQAFTTWGQLAALDVMTTNIVAN
ncbi:glycoside hydrolase family 76 protein [Mucidula mucida]|nr:glycoside hydrolase family 76 protein [Mucidula mucida]